MGVGARAPLSVGNADLGQKLDDAPVSLGPFEIEVRFEHFADLKADSEAGIERCNRLAEQTIAMLPAWGRRSGVLASR